ncbi:MAG: DNA-directed DNA polymerase II small subunit [Candidatus Heimdallarchaeota archaeon]|nr:DNA-directed DNA polymerase II small subunit [Candidatus Heimdallarchaeota archaeon]
MENLKSAIQKLIQAGIIVDREAFEVLQQNPDPLALANSFLELFPSKTEFHKSDIKHIIQRSIPSNQMESHKPPTQKGGIIPRRHSQRRNLNISEKKNEVLVNDIDQHHLISTSFDDLQGLKNYETEYLVIKNPQISQEYKGDVDNILIYFQDRFNKLSALFRNRSDITSLTRIKDLSLRRDEGEVSVIGMITETFFSSQGGGWIKIEDPHSDSMIQVILPINNKILQEKCVQLLNDTVICVMGYLKGGKIIANDVILPDIPNIRKQRRADIPVHVAFLSDIHIGSKNFIEPPLSRFVEFLNGNFGNKKMRAMGTQTKYVLFGGDVVDGVGVYPNQLNDLAIDDIKEQYNVFAGYIERFPDDVEVFMIPGNHDMVRSAEPQPAISEKFLPGLNNLHNVHQMANPSQISLHSVSILLYHCTSIPDIMNSIPGVPNDKPGEVMKHMLKARHLAPIWGAKTPIAAEPEDHLVIESVPDIFHGGHMHINDVTHYKGVQIINSGTMQNQTSFQKSLNIIPTPGQITITNLKTLGVNKIDFLKSS